MQIGWHEGYLPGKKSHSSNSKMFFFDELIRIGTWQIRLTVLFLHHSLHNKSLRHRLRADQMQHLQSLGNVCFSARPYLTYFCCRVILLIMLHRASTSVPSGVSVAAVTHSADTRSTVVELADGKLFSFIHSMYMSYTCCKQPESALAWPCLRCITVTCNIVHHSGIHSATARPLANSHWMYSQP